MKKIKKINYSRFDQAIGTILGAGLFLAAYLLIAKIVLILF
jgi:hypothetical protein